MHQTNRQRTTTPSNNYNNNITTHTQRRSIASNSQPNPTPPPQRKSKTAAAFVEQIINAIRKHSTAAPLTLVTAVLTTLRNFSPQFTFVTKRSLHTTLPHSVQQLLQRLQQRSSDSSYTPLSAELQRILQRLRGIWQTTLRRLLFIGRKASRMVVLLLLIAALSVAAVVYYYAYYDSRCCRPVVLAYEPTNSRAAAILDRCTNLKRFRPTWWATNTHLQTILNVTLREDVQLSFTREQLELFDGEELGTHSAVCLDWLDDIDDAAGASTPNPPTAAVGERPHDEGIAYTEEIRRCQTQPETTQSPRPIVLVLPGFLGDSSVLEIRHFVRSAREHGFQPVVFNYRGTANSSLTSAMPPGIVSSDVQQVVDHIVRTRPTAPLLLCGFSMGSNMMVKYLGESRAALPPQLIGAVSVSNPFDLHRSALALERKPSFTRLVYGSHFVARRKQLILRHEHIYRSVGIDLDVVARASTNREIDDAVSRVLARKASVEELYLDQSSAPWLASVPIPLLCLNAIDDPIASHDAIPKDIHKQNSNVIVATTDRGGHVAWLEGWFPLRGKSWMEKATLQFMEELLRTSTTAESAANQNSATTSTETTAAAVAAAVDALV